MAGFGIVGCEPLDSATIALVPYVRRRITICSIFSDTDEHCVHEILQKKVVSAHSLRTIPVFFLINTNNLLLFIIKSRNLKLLADCFFTLICTLCYRFGF
jgi:hypothetical protein